MNDRPNAKCRRPTLFENRRNLIAIRETNGCSRCIHQKLLGQVACNGILILQQEFLENRAVVLVSHAERQIKRMSSRVVLLEKGKIRSDGDPDSVLKEYAALPEQ